MFLQSGEGFITVTVTWDGVNDYICLSSVPIWNITVFTMLQLETWNSNTRNMELTAEENNWIAKWLCIKVTYIQLLATGSRSPGSLKKKKTVFKVCSYCLQYCFLGLEIILHSVNQYKMCLHFFFLQILICAYVRFAYLCKASKMLLSTGPHLREEENLSFKRCQKFPLQISPTQIKCSSWILKKAVFGLYL